MKKFLSTLKGKIVAVLAGLAIVGAISAYTAGALGYSGYNANPAGGGLNGIPGVVLAQNGSAPLGTALTTGNTACAGAGSGTQLNGGVYQLTTSATTVTCVLVFPVAAPNGYLCQYIDLTTVGAVLRQTSYTTTSCTTFSSGATVGAADAIIVLVEAF
ncbi:MAG: hypothetical protein ACHQ9S_18735 [Candidatus Binatia bacterium]